MSLRDRLNQSKKILDSPSVPLPQLDFISATPSNEKNNKELQKLKETLHSMLVDKVNSTTGWSNYTDDEQKQVIKQFVEAQLSTNFSSIPLNKGEKNKIIQEILQETKGYGPLDPILSDPSVSDILINGYNHVYIEKGGKLLLTNVSFRNNDHLMTIIERIVSQVGRRIDENSPMVDARLPDGSRVNAIIPPLAIDGPSMSIRRFKADAGTMQSLLKWGSMTKQMAEVLSVAVKSRLNIVISGGTGAGKTTLLNSLSSKIPNDERIVTIEDSAELALQQEHIVRLETRPPNIEGKGSISAKDLVMNSLRMRPDRIIIGECRGAEALDMLQAMNTGHDGSLTTLHANTPRDALSRMETMVLYSGVDLPEKNIKQQISAAVDLIVQASRLSDGSRRVTHITEIIGMEGNIISMQDIFKWEQQGIDENGKVIGEHISTGIRPQFADKCKTKGINLALENFNKDSTPIYLCKNPPNTKIKRANNNILPTKTQPTLQSAIPSTGEDNALANRLNNQ